MPRIEKWSTAHKYLLCDVVGIKKNVRLKKEWKVGAISVFSLNDVTLVSAKGITVLRKAWRMPCKKKKQAQQNINKLWVGKRAVLELIIIIRNY